MVGSPESEFQGAGQGHWSLSHSVLLGSSKNVGEGGGYSLYELFYLLILFVLFCIDPKVVTFSIATGFLHDDSHIVTYDSHIVILT